MWILRLSEQWSTINSLAKRTKDKCIQQIEEIIMQQPSQAVKFCAIGIEYSKILLQGHNLPALIFLYM